MMSVTRKEQEALMKKSRWAVLSALVASLLPIGTVLAQGGPALPWSAIAGGGGHATAGAVALDNAIGQWAASVGAQISSGFLPGATSMPAGRQSHYLPLVVKR